MASKPILWVGSALADLRKFPIDARRSAGHQLHLVQEGLDPSDWKPMSAIGPGVREIRIHTQLEHRVIYVAQFLEGIYVLHAFEKRARRTPKQDIDLARRRLKELIGDKQHRRLE